MPDANAAKRAFVALCLGATLAAAACKPREEAPPPVDAQPVTPVAAPPAPSQTPLTPLGRADLIAAARDAASAFAAARAPDAADSLAGRRFALNLAFGCAGPQPPLAEGAAGDGLPRWSWGPDRKTIQITLAPGDWKPSALVAGAPADWEAVEGLWVERPWMSVDGCPGAAADQPAGDPPAPSPQTLGLAAVFEADGSRLKRRNGRAYASTVRGEGDDPAAAPADGYRLVVEGRFAAWPSGQTLRCRAASPDQRPVCIAAVQLDRIAFTTADGAQLSEWRPNG